MAPPAGLFGSNPSINIQQHGGGVFGLPGVIETKKEQPKIPPQFPSFPLPGPTTMAPPGGLFGGNPSQKQSFPLPGLPLMFPPEGLFGGNPSLINLNNPSQKQSFPLPGLSPKGKIV